MNQFQTSAYARQLIPVYRDSGANANTEYFVDAADLAPTIENSGVHNVITSALKFGKVVNLLGISQVDAMILSGEMTFFDNLSGDLQISKLYLKIDQKVVSLDVAHLAGSNFCYKVSKGTRTLAVYLWVSGTGMLDSLTVSGEFNVETSLGTLEAVMDHQDSLTQMPKIIMLGYELNAWRGNVTAQANDLKPTIPMLQREPVVPLHLYSIVLYIARAHQLVREEYIVCDQDIDAAKKWFGKTYDEHDFTITAITDYPWYSATRKGLVSARILPVGQST